MRRAPSAVGRALAGLAALLAVVAALAACSALDREQAELCRATVPAFEPDGRLVIDALSADPLLAHGIRVDYTVEDGGEPREGVVRCAFGGGRLAGDRMQLRGIEVNGEPVPPARLLFLSRFWLAVPDAVAAGERRLAGVTEEPLLGFDLPARPAYYVQQGVNALPTAAFYAFLAVAYALVYGLVNRINLAFGEIAVVGSYAAVAAVSTFGATVAAGGAVGAAVVVAVTLVAAFAHAALVGAVIGEAVFRPLARAGHRSFLIATIGLSIVLTEAMRLWAGSRDRWIQQVLNEPTVLIGGPFEVTMTAMQAVETAGAVVVLGVVLWAATRTAFGRAWRAIADDPPMARLLGVDTARVAGLTFALSAALAGLAGGMVALHYGHASYGAGTIVGLKALAAALLGGIGSLPGAAVGGVLIGFAEVFWSATLPVEWRDVVILAALVVFLVLRPEGLFGVGRPAADTADVRWAAREEE
ncbi:branched-chain amino acid ABC transporter permease [Oharaeibacter diazotrophicus]|uniref:Amino acid/amide ABC transporter membrane protein 1 (HAAT family) n=1 Tax=Oharaeibacter diazotrophicus TaxID=1920512 RepID=A0A4V3CWH9_9HYPH|nr:branched-chain amino acid ABC transporter permease [Oharaeibacter diazotrophicus]TDP86448.1 amino acid/amide ABC transporter membrane protein 1 (HAAT family) [Oharaeibacter diazotrophicus]BBE71610.1 high-affinity branched-chain amino acid transport system permease protein LivH [Pleomorphomonas sp. SM30]GLS78372.1 hypothetical protein GCM10007904_37090 [Oharaeibacter diazotrophicus]